MVHLKVASSETYIILDKASRSSTPSIRDDSISPDLENLDSGLKENTEIEEHLLDYVFKNSNNQFNDKVLVPLNQPSGN